MVTKSGLILFGDSVFLGIGASQNTLGCGMILKSIIQSPVMIKAQSRDTTRDALRRIEKEVLAQKDYNYVFILFGNNDCRLININIPKVTLAEYKENLKKIVNLIAESKKVPVICNLQPLDDRKAFITLSSMKKFAVDILPNSWQKQYSDACKEVAVSCRTKLIDIRSELEKEENTVIAEDGLHPNDKGHRIIASTIEEEINNILGDIVLVHNER